MPQKDGKAPVDTLTFLLLKEGRSGDGGVVEKPSSIPSPANTSEKVKNPSYDQQITQLAGRKG